jgi:fumarate hydratase subunit beta
MAERTINTPIDTETVRSLELGEIVYIDGMVYTMRDEAHIRALELHEKGEDIPVELKNAVIYHCGPITVRDGDSWRMVAAGPTTSARMNSMEPKFIETFEVSAFIGKGGMNDATCEAMAKHGCVYLAITGGAAVLASRGIESIDKVDWFDMGMPEALWHLRCRHLGPLVVAIDAYGKSVYRGVQKVMEKGEERAREILGI